MVPRWNSDCLQQPPRWQWRNLCDGCRRFQSDESHERSLGRFGACMVPRRNRDCLQLRPGWRLRNLCDGCRRFQSNADHDQWHGRSRPCLVPRTRGIRACDFRQWNRDTRVTDGRIDFACTRCRATAQSSKTRITARLKEDQERQQFFYSTVASRYRYETRCESSAVRIRPASSSSSARSAGFRPCRAAGFTSGSSAFRGKRCMW